MSNDPISSLEQSVLAAVGDNDQVKQAFDIWRTAHAGKTIKVQRPITREEADRLARLIESGSRVATDFLPNRPNPRNCWISAIFKPEGYFLCSSRKTTCRDTSLLPSLAN